MKPLQQKFAWIVPALGALLIGVLITGCGSEVADDWTEPTGPFDAAHPFETRYDHGEWLADNGYDFERCLPCHQVEKQNDEITEQDARVCSGCHVAHQPEEHRLYFDNAAEHASWMAGHGYPYDACFTCHANVETADQIVFGGVCSECHDDELGAQACNTCHGDFGEDATVPENWAPRGEAAGAHLAHLESSFSTVECSDCHRVPSEVDSPFHYSDDTPGQAEVRFADQISGEYDFDERTCAVECHYETEWNWDADPPQLGCASCHGYPPETGVHPDNINCVECHSSVVDDGNEIANPELHVNGVVNFN